jgi:integrase
MAPAQVRKERTIWSRADVRDFLAKRADDPLVAFYTVQLFTGLRPSETLGLKWSDVDLFSPTPQVRVRRTLYRPKIGGGWTLERTKTDKHRTVPLVPQAVAALVRHRERQGAERLVAGDAYADYDFVFARPTGEPLRADLVSKQFVRAVTAAGMRPMRLYDARHTCATLLLEAGEPLKVAQEVLGHSTIALTADLYSHVRPEMAHRAMARLAAFVDGTDETRTAE